ncbi:MAG: lipid-A-disaccharide synthase-related protein [Trueperaceae bacterium]|nr:lipid-A-disaccharide synthase-related protein [Trueperaceae bacterium]
MSRAAHRLWLVSNGHAEDALAAALWARAAARLPAWRATALPLVGDGRAYAAADAAADLVGPRRNLPAGGLTMHHPILLWRDLRSGILAQTASQLRVLRQGEADAVLVVGDVFAQAMAAALGAPRRFVLQPLVSVRMADGRRRVAWNRVFMEGIRGPERRLLSRAEVVYTRDEPTAAWLRQRGVRATYLGNPIMDGLRGRRLDPWPDLPTVALLPGSRAYATEAVGVMLEALAVLADRGRELAAAVAWTQAAAPPPRAGWKAEHASGAVGPVWRRAGVRVAWVRGRFQDVLATADAVLGATGTAQEQAVGLGLPVVTFASWPAPGHAFLANQARLLGPSLEVVARESAAIAAAVARALDDPERRAIARRDGPARLGGPGGTAAIAADLVARLAGPSTA